MKEYIGLTWPTAHAQQMVAIISIASIVLEAYSLP
jgi:hypothetical protein